MDMSLQIRSELRAAELYDHQVCMHTQRDETMNFAFTMMNSAFKMMHFAFKTPARYDPLDER